MILNHDKKFLVFQSWKAASSTLYLRLEKFNQSPYSRFYYFNPYLQRIVHQHITVADLKGLPDVGSDYKKAAFVRNPYDRVYSGFIQIQRDLKEQPGLPFPAPWIRAHVMKQLAANEERLTAAGYDFDKWLGLLQEEDVYQIGGNSSLPIYPAHYWTHDGDRPFVDFIGKVEHFEADFQKLMEFLGISEGYSLENDNLSEPLSEGTEDYRYVSKMSASSIERINRLFEKDFLLFHYKVL